MKTHLSRREFIKKSALVAGAGVSLPLLPAGAQETNATTATLPPALPPAPAPIPAPSGLVLCGINNMTYLC